ncbi:MAG: hypothetical protein A2W99_05825 [Bacteroidetes bacterium GWF2_33_16]|nr:MAG: hypothetical protein A2X00_13070 [Bacteroidetes bacterium GWE2_32_14]OFY05205.1 MAG: hypothetical protein A2W99_05825 [Bacteroidetes bacterium GWF2_33_16]
MVLVGLNVQVVYSQVVYPSEPDTTKKEELPQEVKQDKPAVTTDIIYQHDGTKMLVNVKKIQMNDLFYSLPGETKVNKMDQRLVYKIEYKTGKIEILNEKPTEIRDVGDYRKIKVTYDPKDVDGLIEIAQLEARADGNEKSYSTPKSLERTAIIVLRRKAALINSDIVFITDKKTHVAFGEIPFIILYAKAYSYK